MKNKSTKTITDFENWIKSPTGIKAKEKALNRAKELSAIISTSRIISVAALTTPFGPAHRPYW